MSKAFDVINQDIRRIRALEKQIEQSNIASLEEAKAEIAKMFEELENEEESEVDENKP